MADLIEISEWVAGIYQLETTDPVEGGLNGIDNLQATQLAKRTAYLKQSSDQKFALLDAIATAAGLTVDHTNAGQALDAIQRLIDVQSGNYTLDTGAANAYAVALDPAISAYTNGMTVRFRFAHANTGASTLDAGGGAVALVNDVGGALLEGDAPAGGIATATYDEALNKFLITSLVPSQAMSQAAADARYAELAGNVAQQFSASRFISSASGMPKFSAYRDVSDQAVISSAWTKVELNAELFDTNANFDEVTNFRFTPAVEGYYQINWVVICGASSGMLIDARSALFKNGSMYKYGASILGAGGTFSVNNAILSGSSLVYMNGTTDYLELYGNITGASPRFCWGNGGAGYSSALDGALIV